MFLCYLIDAAVLPRYASRVNYDVACSMDFHYYPHDVQTCLVR